ncbi:MAG TPA: DNA-3-methyladenine glycosylase [Candidatus Saccharimonadia bacterium]|nr:DNA-3-methyladenine glycosylase [Candidatus Saccharimonadia bacterium]
MDDFGILSGPAEWVAPRLLGSLLVRELDGERLVGRIVETEAYDQTDAASHSYRGRTPRTDVMFGPAGHMYVYFTYGMHYCMNIVCGPEGHGAAVLIRALEPIEGEAVMLLNRGGRGGTAVSNGPAKVCQALAINKHWNGHNLRNQPLQLMIQPPVELAQIVQTIRVGITQAADVPWRFYIRDNPYVSKQSEVAFIKTKNRAGI